MKRGSLCKSINSTFICKSLLLIFSFLSWNVLKCSCLMRFSSRRLLNKKIMVFILRQGHHDLRVEARY